MECSEILITLAKNRNFNSEFSRIYIFFITLIKLCTFLNTIWLFISPINNSLILIIISYIILSKFY